MLYEVITEALGRVDGLEPGVLVRHGVRRVFEFRRELALREGHDEFQCHRDAVARVITSYSIHYTKLYEAAMAGIKSNITAACMIVI